jgi:hypothetical protein
MSTGAKVPFSGHVKPAEHATIQACLHGLAPAKGDVINPQQEEVP